MEEKGKVGQYLDDFKYVFASIDRKKITYLLVVLWVVGGFALVAALLEILYHKVKSGDSYFLKIFLFCLWIFIFTFFFDTWVESAQELVFEEEWALGFVFSVLEKKMKEQEKTWKDDKVCCTSSRKELIAWVKKDLEEQYPNNNNIEKTIGGIIRRLRLKGYVTFQWAKGDGKYLWRWKNFKC